MAKIFVPTNCKMRYHPIHGHKQRSFKFSKQQTLGVLHTNAYKKKFTSIKLYVLFSTCWRISIVILLKLCIAAGNVSSSFSDVNHPAHAAQTCSQKCGIVLGPTKHLVKRCLSGYIYIQMVILTESQHLALTSNSWPRNLFQSPNHFHFALMTKVLGLSTLSSIIPSLVCKSITHVRLGCNRLSLTGIRATSSCSPPKK